MSEQNINKFKEKFTTPSTTPEKPANKSSNLILILFVILLILIAGGGGYYYYYYIHKSVTPVLVETIPTIPGQEGGDLNFREDVSSSELPSPTLTEN